MKNSQFCHLHVHTEYSQLDGFGSPEKYAQRAKELGFKYLACTDHGNVDAAINFQKACDKQGISPIIGCEGYIVPNMEEKIKGEKRGHITLLVKNFTGWTNLCKILTKANLHGFYYKPRLDYKTVLENCEGLVIMTACAGSFIRGPIGQELFFDLYERIGDDLYLEIMPHLLTDQNIVNDLALDFRFDDDGGNEVKLIATNDCHYLLEEDSLVQEVLLAIQRKTTWNDPKRWKFGIKGLHLRTADEMIEAFREQGTLKDSIFKRAMKNTIKVAQKCCDFRVPKRDIQLPPVEFLKESSQNESDEMHTLCKEGYTRIFGGSLEDNEEYLERFNEEFSIIESKNFIRYFLIVHELINWCAQNNILVGPGRGSVGGSLVAFLMGITSVDPIKFRLIFSRFIAEERIDYPDIDIDFEDAKRSKIREHLIEIYGANNIAGVSTFMRMKGRAVIRDVGRVFEIPAKTIDEFAKTIDPIVKDKGNIGLVEKSLKETPEGQLFLKKYPKESAIAVRLEGTIRNAGQHAAATIISDNDLTIGEQCYLANRNKNVVINWEMQDSEFVGLMKLDVLGLNTLSILNEAKSLIRLHHNKNIHFPDINLEDLVVLRDFAYGYNAACFQFNSHGMINLCKKMKVNKFNDLIAANALFRPGTLRSGMVDVFIERKNGGKYKCANEIIEEITKSTYGILVYQEQIMFLANQVAGWPWKDTDKIRKVIAKSKGKKAIQEFKDRFINGCLEQKTLTKKQATELWKDLEEFGGYSFNKCISGDEKIKRMVGRKPSQFYPTIREMYKIKNDLEYARKTNHENLRAKYKWSKDRWGKGCSLNEDDRIIKNKIIDIRFEGIRSIFRVTLEDGRSIDVTRNHRFPTNNGKKETQYLQIGKDKLFVIDKYDNQDTNFVAIKSIEFLKKGDVYDIEMENPYHTFVTGQNIVTCNSHSTAYAMIGYWCQWMKKYYPSEFICGALTHGAEDKKAEIVKEAGRLGLKIYPPKIGISDSHKWTQVDGKLYTPFIDIKGVGEKTAEKAAKIVPENQKVRKGFFGNVTTSTKSGKPTKLEKILREISAYDENAFITSEASQYFSFDILQNPAVIYPKLSAFIGTKNPGELNRYRELRLIKEFSVHEYSTPRARLPKVLKCKKCELVNECEKPMMPSPGAYNVAIIDELPHKADYENKRFLSGRYSKRLWKELEKRGHERGDFHVTSCIKCHASLSKKATPYHQKQCKEWLVKEMDLIQCRLVLAFGNGSLSTLINEPTGILAKNATSEWVEDLGAWVCWCVHPSFAFNNENKALFNEGIDNFIKVFDRLSK